MPDSIKIFEKFADKYDNWYKHGEGKILGPLEFKALKESFEHYDKPGIEIGVGSGFFAEKLGIKYGIDPSVNQLKLANEKGIKTVAGIAEQLPFKNSLFDYALLVVTLCFVDDPIKTLQEAHRILKPDGTIITAVIPADSPWGKYYLKKKEKGHIFYDKAVFYTKKELDEMLLKTGFCDLQYTTTLFQEPTENPSEYDKILNKYDKNGGFLIIKAKKKAE